MSNLVHWQGKEKKQSTNKETRSERSNQCSFRTSVYPLFSNRKSQKPITKTAIKVHATQILPAAVASVTSVDMFKITLNTGGTGNQTTDLLTSVKKEGQQTCLSGLVTVNNNSICLNAHMNWKSWVWGADCISSHGANEANRNTLNNNAYNNSSSEGGELKYQLEKQPQKQGVGGGEEEELAPNCQHLSPLKTPGNEKATCQTSSSSLSLAPFSSSAPFPPPFFFFFASSSLWRLIPLCRRAMQGGWRWGGGGVGAAMTASALRTALALSLHSFNHKTLLHSVYLSSSFSSLCSLLNGLNEDMLL